MNNFVLSSYQRQKRQDWVDKHYPGKSNNDAKPTIFDKLRKESRCFGCGEDLHKPVAPAKTRFVGIVKPRDTLSPFAENPNYKTPDIQQITPSHKTVTKNIHTTPITPQTPTSTW